MLWKTHIRIANEVLRKLGIPKSSIEASRLREGSVTPDKWRDFPHHHGKGGTIRKYIFEARRLFLEGDLANCCFCLGVALHYIQDSYTSLSSRSKYHPRWEQQMEQSYFVDNLEELVVAAFRDREDRIKEYAERIRLLSKEIEGRKDTLWVATLPGPGLSFWGGRMWGRPNVDLNFALRTSLLIAKSVLGPKTCSELQTKLTNVLAEYEKMLRKTETLVVDEITELIKKRDELKKRRRPSGVFQVLKSYFLTLLSKIHNQRAKSRIKEYEKQQHLRKVAKEYQETAKKITAPHSGWYNITVPQIDINVVEKELLSRQEASEYFGISESILQDLVEKGRISHYHVRNKELFRKSDLGEVLRA